jgi:predicted transcriptional regulator
MKRGEWHEAARALHAAHPELSNREIGERFGVGQAAVWKALHPDKIREINRRENAERGPYKRAWDRSEQARGECARCGGLMGIGGKANGSTVCWPCYVSDRAEARAEIVRLRREGLKNVEIAKRLGVTFAVVASTLCRERKFDPSIPPSPHYRQEVAA